MSSLSNRSSRDLVAMMEANSKQIAELTKSHAVLNASVASLLNAFKSLKSSAAATPSPQVAEALEKVQADVAAVKEAVGAETPGTDPGAAKPK
jgi:hypothetical protein